MGLFHFYKNASLKSFNSTARLDLRDHSRLPISNPDPIPVASQASKLSSPQCSCLLKSCNRIFTPNHPAQVFCGENCRLIANELVRKAAKKRAEDKYRRTENGKEKRRAQSKRRRLRINAEHEASKLAPQSMRVGDTNRRQKKDLEKKSVPKAGVFRLLRIGPKSTSCQIL